MTDTLPKPPEVIEPQEPMGLPDPHEHDALKPTFKMFARVHEDDINVIQSVSPGYSTKQYIIAAYVKSLAAELRAKGINYYSPDNLKRFAAIVKRRNEFCESDLDRPAVERHALIGPDRTNTGQDESSAKKGVRKRNSNSKAKSTKS